MARRPPIVDAAVTKDDLDRIERKIDRLLAILEPPTADPADVNVLAAIFSVVGSGSFAASACFDRVALAHDEPLRDALIAADCETPQQLGMLLRRIEGRLLDGYLVRRVELSRAGLIWRVLRVEPREPRDERHSRP